jgi:hypothetical protein
LITTQQYIKHLCGDRQAISKKGFWFKIAAKAKLKPQVYSSIPRILILFSTKILSQKTFLRRLVIRGNQGLILILYGNKNVFQCSETGITFRGVCLFLILFTKPAKIRRLVPKNTIATDSGSKEAAFR